MRHSSRRRPLSSPRSRSASACPVRCNPTRTRLPSVAQIGRRGQFRPMSLTTVRSLPRISIRLARSRATRAPESDVPATSAGHSREKSSTTHRMRNRRPQIRLSDTKLSDHRSFAAPSACAYRELVCDRHDDALTALPRDRWAAASCACFPAPACGPGGNGRTGKATQPAHAVIVAAPSPPTSRLVTDHPAAHTDQTTRPTLAKPAPLKGMGDGLPLRAGRYQFIARTFSTRLSCIASTSSYFSRLFSCSSVRNRRASDTSSPTNFDFHL